MKRLLLLGLLLSACKINDATFTPLGGADDGGPDDGHLDDTPIMPIDSPPGLQPLRRGVIIDANGLGWMLNKNAQNGDLSLAVPTGYNLGSQPNAAAFNRAGTHLYVAGGQLIPELRDYPVNGTTIANQGTVVQLGNCANPRSITVHPNGRFLVVGCSNQTYVRVSIDANGMINTRQEFTADQGPITVAFSPNGACLLLADANGPVTQRVRAFQFDPVSGNLTQTPASPGPSSGVSTIATHPSNNYFYVAGSGQVSTYVLNTTTCETATFGNQIPGEPSPSTAVVEPQGTRLYVVGPEVRVYNIAADGRLSAAIGSPILPSSSLTHAAFDPVLPSTIYITGRNPSGTFQGDIDTSTGLFPVGQGVMPPNAAPVSFVMAP